MQNCLNCKVYSACYEEDMLEDNCELHFPVKYSKPLLILSNGPRSEAYSPFIRERKVSRFRDGPLEQPYIGYPWEFSNKVDWEEYEEE